MNFGPVCVRFLWFFLTWCISLGVLRILYCMDEEMHGYAWREWFRVGSSSWLLCVLFLCTKAVNAQAVIFFCYGMFVIYLCSAMTMDIMMKMISDILHIIGFAAGGVLLWNESPELIFVGELAAFVVLQCVVFSKMYGVADVAAFCLCAMFLTGLGNGVEVYVQHMVLTFGMLGIVQGFKGNIARNGNLKLPVGLLPYIAVAFFLII